MSGSDILLSRVVISTLTLMQCGVSPRYSMNEYGEKGTLSILEKQTYCPLASEGAALPIVNNLNAYPVSYFSDFGLSLCVV